jgi:hypothetical protein
MEYDPFTSPIWVFNPPNSPDFLDIEFPSNEAILEAMIESKGPREYMHHISFFLHKLETFEVGTKSLVSLIDVKWYQCPILTHNVYSEGNLESILKTIPIDISMHIGVIENFLTGTDCSTQEIELYIALLK